jgi:hypothetical protein
VTDVDFAEPAQIPLDIGQIQMAQLVDPKPHLATSAGTRRNYAR